MTRTRLSFHLMLTLVLSALIVGCESTPDAEKPNATASGSNSSGSSQALGTTGTDHPDFFTANQWVDTDRSGGADYWEFEGANKWTYRSDENITFVSRIECSVGAAISWKLHAPDGEIIDEGNSSQRWPSTWRRSYAGAVIDLLDTGGPGVWWVEWFVNGDHVGESAANLTP